MGHLQNNAGGAWDNAKKSFEAGVEINGEMTYKGSDAHKAAVTGDTVGDHLRTLRAFYEYSIKLTCLIGLVIAPILGDGHVQWDKKGAPWNAESEKHVLDKYPAKVYNQDSVITVTKEFFPTPYHFSSFNSSDSKMNDSFENEIKSRAKKADDEIEVEEEW